MFRPFVLLSAVVICVLSVPFNLTECGVKKGCYVPQEPDCYNGCNGMGFTYAFLDSTHMRIEIFGKTDAMLGFYYAVGFSYDPNMGDDYVIECSSLGNQKLSMKYSFNVQNGQDPPTNVRVKNEQNYDKNFVNTVTSITDGYAYCAADIDVSGSADNDQIFKFNSSVLYYLLMANGPTNANGLLHHVHDATSIPTNLQDVIPNFDTNSCGTGKRCFLPADINCSNGNNGMMVSYNLLSNDQLQVEIVGKSTSKNGHYVAVGFSDNLQKGQESVIECSSLGKADVSMKFSKNVNNTNVRIANEEKLRSQYLTAKSVYQDGNLFCTGIISLNNPGLFDVFLNSSYYLSSFSGATTTKELSKFSTRCQSDVSSKLADNNENENRGQCGSDKGCFIPQCYLGCNGMSFTYKILDDNVTMQIELTRVGSSAHLYVAVGFSYDDRMGEESVIECSDMGNGYSVKFSYNEGGSSPKNVRIASEEKYRAKLISDQKVVQSEGTLYCKAKVSLLGDASEPKIFKYNSTQPYFFLIASGNTDQKAILPHDHASVADHPVLLTEKMSLTPETFDCSSCGITKGCYFPEGNGNCDGHGFSYTWVNNSQIMDIELILTPSTDFNYVAVGFSDDSIMGNESVIECSQFPGEDYSIKFSYNNGSKKNVRIEGEDKIRATYITSTQYSERDGYVYCKGRVRVNGNTNKEIFHYNADQSYYLLLARGKTSATGLGYHTRTGRYVTDKARDLQKYDEPATTSAPPPSGINCGNCFKEYGCFFPDDAARCTGKGVTYKLIDDNTLQLQMTTPSSNKYIALGFSSDNKMGDDYVIECSAIGTDVFSMKFSYNTNDKKNNRITGEQSIESTYFSNVVKKVEDGVAYCSATVRINGWANDSRVFHYTHGTKYYLLVATGTTSSTDLQYHGSNAAVSGQTDIASVSKVKGMSAKTKKQLIKAHAILMILSWCFFVPTALVFARFLRSSWPLTKPGGLLIWFHVHRTSNLMGIACMVASLACILTSQSWKWTGPGSAASKWGQAHTMTGILALVLAWIQPFISTMRCSPNTPNRFVFNWVHRGIGCLSYVLATTALSIAAFHFKSVWSHSSLQLSLSLVPCCLLVLLCALIPLYKRFTPSEDTAKVAREIFVFEFLLITLAISITLSVLVGVN